MWWNCKHCGKKLNDASTKNGKTRRCKLSGYTVCVDCYRPHYIKYLGRIAWVWAKVIIIAGILLAIIVFGFWSEIVKLRAMLKFIGS